MTIPVSSLFTPKTPAGWLAQLLSDGQAQGLSSTSWQSGDPILTLLAIMATELGNEDSMAISARSQGAFLDFAATGTVTVTNDLIQPPTALVVPVSPDPSIPSQNPTGTPNLLDTLAANYDVVRGQASAATNPIYLANTSGTSLGTFAPGTFHAQNNATGATYSNQVSFTFSASSILGTSVASASGPSGAVQVAFTSPHGLSTGAIVFFQSLGYVADNFYAVTVTGANTVTIVATVVGVFPGSTPPGPNGWSTASYTFAADVIGPAGNAGVGQINQLITSAPKSYCSNLVTLSGAPFQSNVSVAAMCRAKLATLSPNGPSGAYLFYALVSSLILSGQPVNSTGTVLANPLPANITLDGGPVTRVLVTLNTALGLVVTTVANTSGGVDGCMGNPITAATATSPIAITMANPHDCSTGDWCQVNLVGGLSGANGVFQFTKTGANTGTLNGSSGSGTYTASTGQFSGGDVYAVSAVLAAYAKPNAVSQTVQSAQNVATVITATAYVPSAFVSDYTTKMANVMTAYFTTFPIGGLNVDGQSNVLPLGAIEGLLFASGQNGGQFYTLSVTSVALNGAAEDLALGAIGVATLGTLAGINVVGL